MPENEQRKMPRPAATGQGQDTNQTYYISSVEKNQARTSRKNIIKSAQLREIMRKGGI